MVTQQSATPSASYKPVPSIDNPAHLSRGYGNDSSHLDVGVNDFASPGAAYGQHERLGRFEEDFDARTRGPSILDGETPRRSTSRASRASTLHQPAHSQTTAPMRSGTLKKKSSVKRSGSLKRSSSRKSLRAGSIHGAAFDGQEHGHHKEDSVFYTPVPTKGTPTEMLAERFQTWRKFLKDLIAYFREVSSSYEHRAKSLLKVSNVVNNTNMPSAFATEGGLNDANRILRDFHKQAILEANKARDIETDVINQLNGLRADLAQKIKEIKALSGDFKNNVEKEKDTTRKYVAALEEALAVADTDPSAIAGKGDPYVVRLGVERQVERQIDEENYLHRAYINLENSGRELESIVVGEVQKAYNALASIMKRDADEMYSTIEKLRTGPIAMPRDHEWNRFVRSDSHFVNPDIPLRRLEDIEYPGKHHPATTEVRAGMLERKSKYLKSYTPGWYVLSPTHIHEFKSADRIYTQPPVMSLYLPDQKLGSRSQPGSSSHKFVIKGRQAGSMHRGHTWVFRAETFETMSAWYDDIKFLTEKSGEERNAFVRRHASVRSASVGSARSASSDGGLEEDEADAVPYSANQSMVSEAVKEQPAQRPSPGGRFPSDLNVNRNLQGLRSHSSASSEVGQDLTTTSGGARGVHPTYLDDTTSYQADETVHPAFRAQQSQDYNPSSSYADPHPHTQQSYDNQASYADPYASAPPTYENQPSYTGRSPIERQNTDYSKWMGPAAGGAAAGALASEAYRRKQQNQEREARQQEELDQEQFLDSQQQQYPTGQGPAIDYRNSVVPNQERVPEQNVQIPYVHPATIIAASGPLHQSQPHDNYDLATPSTTNTSFLGGSDFASGGFSGNTINGGPVPVELVNASEPFPGMRRQGTDFSVSDLHVPGEFPRIPGTKLPVP
ncbi:hypothetical protein P153DRAFT_375435 [Dothidotthia symphoricarpi CBS 119687]|uniref:PH domain-containing protein n=1 Tax=Dothidotthia symphoricarpi CBS 119687 TaxID=1392245 RepID=A0A6A6AEQ4_9PLEO|nr:uncharacterized protein P153DRAFT_375435 [Dothidotthia symphoricarpi CBS 119687]KAF2129793.1 hypothetical protein P153DRAFT_375435 [Dothidotthia symphoricarpi CBS 119687]